MARYFGHHRSSEMKMAHAGGLAVPRERFEADPFEVQIGAMVIFHRAALASTDAAAHDQLMEISNDFLWYGQMLERERGAAAPWDTSSKNEVGPPEVFLETAECVGCTQSIPRPSLGIDHRNFRLVPRGQEELGRFAPNPTMARARAVIELVQHADRRWQVLHVEVRPPHRRQGLATLLYNEAECFIGARLVPSGWLSTDAYGFWQSRGSPFLHMYRQVEHIPGFWLSPKTLLTLREIAQARIAEVARQGASGRRQPVG